jgi:hypothetical protein
VLLGATTWFPLKPTLPTSSILTSVAPETLQLSVDVSPSLILPGLAVNEFMTGAWPFLGNVIVGATHAGIISNNVINASPFLIFTSIGFMQDLLFQFATKRLSAPIAFDHDNNPMPLRLIISMPLSLLVMAAHEYAPISLKPE